MTLEDVENAVCAYHDIRREYLWDAAIDVRTTSARQMVWFLIQENFGNRPKVIAQLYNTYPHRVRYGIRALKRKGLEKIAGEVLRQYVLSQHDTTLVCVL